MGTNYYWKRLTGTPCEHCGRGDVIETIHIGKSSAGWCFGLHVVPDLNITSLADWECLFATPNSYIENEYDERVTPEEMLSIITNRGRDEVPCPSPYRDWAHFHERNYSEPGPNNLIRHRVSPASHCVANGEGTYDYIQGEFC